MTDSLAHTHTETPSMCVFGCNMCSSTGPVRSDCQMLLVDFPQDKPTIMLQEKFLCDQAQFGQCVTSQDFRFRHESVKQQ